jgi:uncharacterized membrane-anchored protein
VSHTRRIAFAVLVAAQLLVPLALIGVNELALATGYEVTLATTPVDPLDPFRGRYVVLRYEISTLPGWSDRDGTVYVELEEQGDRWVAYRVHAAYPDTDRPVIRGTVERGAVTYGIETYFADEDEAPRLEREARAGGLLVDVVLDDDGRARIDEVRVR